MTGMRPSVNTAVSYVSPSSTRTAPVANEPTTKDVGSPVISTSGDSGSTNIFRADPEATSAQQIESGELLEGFGEYIEESVASVTEWFRTTLTTTFASSSSSYTSYNSGSTSGSGSSGDGEYAVDTVDGPPSILSDMPLSQFIEALRAYYQNAAIQDRQSLSTQLSSTIQMSPGQIASMSPEDLSNMVGKLDAALGLITHVLNTNVDGIPPAELAGLQQLVSFRDTLAASNGTAQTEAYSGAVEILEKTSVEEEKTAVSNERDMVPNSLTPVDDNDTNFLLERPINQVAMGSSQAVVNSAISLGNLKVNTAYQSGFSPVTSLPGPSETFNPGSSRLTVMA